MQRHLFLYHVIICPFLQCLLLSYIYSFFIINSSIFYVWVLFSFCSVVVTKMCCHFSLDTVYTLSSRRSYVHYSFSPPGCSPRNGHPFLLAFVTHSCILLWHFTFDDPSHSASRHLTTEQLDFANDDLSDPFVNETKEMWSVVNHSRLERLYFSLLYELGCGNGWDSAWTWTKICCLFLILAYWMAFIQHVYYGL